MKKLRALSDFIGRFPFLNDQYNAPHIPNTTPLVNFFILFALDKMFELIDDELIFSTCLILAAHIVLLVIITLIYRNIWLF
jgi:hypothetical protein